MNIVVAASEVVPFAKTGGLADVCGALPIDVACLGHRVAVFMPAYRSIHSCGHEIEPTDMTFKIPIGSKMVTGRLLQGKLPNSNVTIYFVDQPTYYDRQELYREKDADYHDNCERFVFFCRATLAAIEALGEPVDLVHCHDWQTGLIPALLKIESSELPAMSSIASLLTIHNLAYQGQFWHWDMALTGIDWKHFNWREMEFHGKLNLLKTGIVFADAINTVSPQYAREIQTPLLGNGLDGVLRMRSGVLSGILNGVDYNVWNPAIDKYLVQTYDVESWRDGKTACKADLQKRMELPLAPQTPLISIVGRLANQKGWDLVIPVIQRWIRDVDSQWAVLGIGDQKYQRLLRDLASDFPNKVAVHLGFSDELAHKIEAGADISLMPSHYEPCGLNQLYSLKYGTVPVVHATGGLVDTITEANTENLELATANGFLFDDYSPKELDAALERAVSTYCNDSPIWRRIIETGMRQDWSWSASARRYEELYQRTVAQKRET